MLGEEAQWADWMRAANAGDNGAYRRLLEALAPFLRKVVRQGFIRAGLGAGDMEDVVQETLLAIHLKRQTWDADQLFTPWLRAIARNKLIDNLRRRGNRTELPIEDFVDVLPAESATEELSAREADRLLSILGGRQQEIVRAICVEGSQHPRGLGPVRDFRRCHPRGLAPGLERAWRRHTGAAGNEDQRFHQRTRAGPCGVPQA